MLRKGLLILGGALALLAVVGLAVDRSATMLWFDVIAALLTIGSAFIVEDEHTLGMSLGLGPAVIGLGLVAVFLIGRGGLIGHQPAWAVWFTFVLGIGSLGLAMALVTNRQHELRTHPHF